MSDEFDKYHPGGGGETRSSSSEGKAGRAVVQYWPRPTEEEKEEKRRIAAESINSEEPGCPDMSDAFAEAIRKANAGRTMLLKAINTKNMLAGRKKVGSQKLKVGDYVKVIQAFSIDRYGVVGKIGKIAGIDPGAPLVAIKFEDGYFYAQPREVKKTNRKKHDAYWKDVVDREKLEKEMRRVSKRLDADDPEKDPKIRNMIDSYEMVMVKTPPFVGFNICTEVVPVRPGREYEEEREWCYRNTDTTLYGGKSITEVIKIYMDKGYKVVGNRRNRFYLIRKKGKREEEHN